MASPPSTIPQVSPAEFADRMTAAFPVGWASVDAQAPGGILRAVFEVIAGELADQLGVPQFQNVTIGGAITAHDEIVLTFANPNLSEPRRVAYTVLAGDTAAAAARGLANAISSDPPLSALGFRARAHTPTIEIKYPTAPPLAVWSTGSPPSNATVITATVDGSETVTIAPVPYEGPGTLQYAAYATRIQTAIGEALDLSALDFLGPGQLDRLPGELDAPYRTRIMAALMPTGATRKAISDAIQRVTGVKPRLVEPWSPGDTGVTRNFAGPGAMYSGVDTEVTPSRATMGRGQFRSSAYMGFVDTVLPTVPLLGGNPVPCTDDGMYSGVAGSSTFNFPPFLSGRQVVYNAIERSHTYGTLIWVRFTRSLSPPKPRGQFLFNSPFQTAQWWWFVGYPRMTNP